MGEIEIPEALIVQLLGECPVRSSWSYSYDGATGDLSDRFESAGQNPVHFTYNADGERGSFVFGIGGFIVIVVGYLSFGRVIGRRRADRSRVNGPHWHST